MEPWFVRVFRGEEASGFASGMTSRGVFLVGRRKEKGVPWEEEMKQVFSKGLSRKEGLACNSW